MSREVLPLFLTVDEVAVLLRTSPKAIYARIERGQLAGVRRDGRRRILVSSAELLESLGCAPSSGGKTDDG